MRVLVVTNMYPSPERPHWGAFVKSQADSLAARGCENTLYEIHGWRSKREYLRAFAELSKVARACGAELVHAHYGYTGAAAVGVRLPLVVSFCGDDLLGAPLLDGGITLKSRALVGLSRWAARKAHGVIVKSAQMREIIADVPDVHVIPNGVDLARFTPAPRTEARAKLGWRAEGQVLLFAAHPDETRKNFALAREVEQRLRTQGLDVRLEVEHNRPHAEMVDAMNASDVLLLPSLHEGSPNVLKEAMAVNLPVVASPVGDCAERLQGVTPSAVAALDAGAFTSATAAVLAAGTRSNGREHVVRTLSLEAV
ncbi:MAG: glycosyltransferase, partial [Candidatus Eisenbacteria bacterium]